MSAGNGKEDLDAFLERVTRAPTRGVRLAKDDPTSLGSAEGWEARERNYVAPGSLTGEWRASIPDDDDQPRGLFAHVSARLKSFLK